MKTRGLLGLGMSCWLLGCAVDASGQGDADGLCASCTRLSGGETNDFGGGQENCEEEEVPLSAAVRRELGVDETMTTLAEPFSASLRFQLEDEARPDTTVTATATFGTPEYLQIGVEATDACRDSVRVPVELSVAASDGAFAAVATGILQMRRGDLSWRLLAKADLAQTTGNLELELDESRPHLGELSLDLKGFPTGPRGNVSVRIYYPGDGAPLDRIPIEDESPGSEFVHVDVARFPADHCGSNSFPLDNDEHHDWLGGSTPRELYDAARASFPTIATARWRAGNTTDLSVALDELPASSEACLAASFGDAYLTFDSSAQLQTEDGRVEAEVIGSHLALDGSSGIAKTLYLSRTLHSLTASQVESKAGIEGLAVGSSDLLTVAFDLEYAWQDGVVAGGGIIEVIDDRSGERVECVAWPEGSHYQEERCILPP
jgi:hypothetical protein